MDDVKIWVLDSRGVYNFMGINLVAKLTVSFFRYNVFFSKIGFRFMHISAAIYVQIQTGIEFALSV